MVRVWTLQDLEAHALAYSNGGMLRASPDHVQDSDFSFKNSYAWMAKALQERVGSCPAAVEEAWKHAGGKTSPPSPVWVWVQYDGENHKKPILSSFGAGGRMVFLEAEVPREFLLVSQFGAWGHVLNNCDIAICEKEDDELSSLRKTDPEEYERRKHETWSRIFNIDWQGDTYCLQKAEDAAFQAVLWELPLDAVVSAQRQVSLAYSNSSDYKAVQVNYGASVLGDDVALSAEWYVKKQHIPRRQLRLMVTSITAGGPAAIAGVNVGWSMNLILNDIQDADPLPGLPELHNDRYLRPGEKKKRQTDDDNDSSSSDGNVVPGLGSDDGFPVAADALLQDILALTGVTVQFEPPAAPDSDDDADTTGD